MDSDIAARAIATIRAQEEKGRSKYGTDLDNADLSVLEVVEHAVQEAADLLMYLSALRKYFEGIAADIAALDSSMVTERVKELDV